MRLHLPTRLRELREKAGMSITDVAAAMNIARASILSWEKGLTEPDLLQRMILARIFNVSYLGLLGNKEMQGIRNDEMSYGKYTRNGFL